MALENSGQAHTDGYLLLLASLTGFSSMHQDHRPSYLAPGVTRREAWSWAMFDFANSGYTTVVITAIFNAYFVAVVAGNEDWGTFAWTISLAISYGLIILTAPALGAYADAYGAKKRLLF